MKNSPFRWVFKGKLKLVFISVVAISTLFISYQVFYYAALDQFQTDESAAYVRQRLLKKEIPVKPPNIPDTHTINKKEKTLEARKGPSPNRRRKPVSGLVVGVAPEYQKYYSKRTSKFACLSSKRRRIEWDKVNDDYCDCPIDGSDEPSTSACMNGRFYCTKSTKHYAEYIPSSRVNDMICDCCDGSEEYLNPTLCKDTCK